VFDDGGLGHVDGQLADVRHVIGDALEVLGDEEEVSATVTPSDGGPVPVSLIAVTVTV
jgi:hypothetical protein